MKRTNNKIIFFIVLAAIINGCAGQGALQKKNTHIYNQNYDRMTEVVKRAIRSGPRKIDLTNEIEKDSLMHIQFKQSTHIGTQRVQEAEGMAIIRKMTSSKTSVEIEDPEYSAMVPDRKRKKYDRVISNNIDQILGK